MTDQTIVIHDDMQPAFEHIQRIWPNVMAGECMTQAEWDAESDNVKITFYRWIKDQYGELADLES